ncbi:hypothetical protein FAF44_18810 [Nonomuraea sp. MG754425]|uniref:hypothetical protein n=1 Tax=Nonomuraea sp. MG754425 TaxID=2570319 RepID=UPI001F2F71E3|nr:hypothetical protein [Nonomuraea sp. MG754425]MCF6470432.1 hypothetical protein [Nonomuraea sp. MG754425]
MNIGDWLAKVLLWVVGLAVITVVLAVVPFIFHWNLLEALASGACTAGCFAVSMLYRKWKGRSGPPPE